MQVKSGGVPAAESPLAASDIESVRLKAERATAQELRPNKLPCRVGTVWAKAMHTTGHDDQPARLPVDLI
jgi:hypothetical protein